MPFRFVSTAGAARLLSLLSLFAAGACGDGVSGLLLGPLSQQEDEENDAGVNGGPALAPSAQSRPRGSAGETGLPEPIDWYVSRCSPTIRFENLDTSDVGSQAELLIDDPTLLIQTAAQSVCLALYRAAEEVPKLESIHFVIESFDGVGDIAGEKLRLSSKHLTSFDEQSGNGRAEALGISIYLLAHLYQQILPETPYWVISGKADATRLHAGLLDQNGAARGGHFSDGSRTSAYFFAWIESTHPDFLYHLNQRMKPEPASGSYSDALFQEITGTDLPTLWSDYQATF